MKMPARFIVIASSKGGIGKSTAALGISRSLCARAHSVLLCDLDYGNACLDMLCGVEDSVLYTSADAALGVCTPQEALIALEQPSGGAPCEKSGGSGRMYLLPAPCAGQYEICVQSAGDTDGCPADSPGRQQADSGQVGGKLSADTVYAARLCDVLREAAEAAGAEYVILDTGAGISGGLCAAAGAASEALVVAGHSPVSLRSADATARLLEKHGIKNIRLVINSFDAAGVTDRKIARSGIFSMIDTARIPLCGIVPYDPALAAAQESGKKTSSLSDAAFANIAARLDGEDVPLFCGIKRFRKNRNKFYI